MASSLIRMRVKAGMGEQFEALARSLYADSHAHEPALRRYEYWRGQEPDTYYCLQSFDDYRGFIAHETAPYHEAAAEPIMALIEDFDLQWIDAVEGAAPFASSREQDLPASAGERERLYASLFPLARAGWWPQLAEEPTA